jgi:putative ABC transport system permease protein
MLFEAIKLALRTIRRNVLRSILTLLGIVIGVASVIALVTLGQGTTDKVTADLAKLGSNMLIARTGGPAPGPPQSSEGRSFTVRDVEALRAGVQNVRGISPSANKQTNVVFGSNADSVTVTGADPIFFTVQDWSFAQGGPFTEAEARGGEAVCVIGETVRREIMALENPVNETLRVGSVPCRIIGVMAAKGQSAFGSDQDQIVVMPLRTFHRRIAGNMRISSIAISTLTQDDMAPAQAAIMDILRETRRVARGAEDNFTVRDMTQIASTLSATSTVMTGLLSAVAAVSLLVGGIGIMNIMLVSVAERTREIGIRLAIGALGNQVLTQFLVEAIVLCLLGGLIGIALGLGLARFGATMLEVPFVVAPSTVLMSFGFSGLIGLIFGFFPARRAAKLDPIEALRHE